MSDTLMLIWISNSFGWLVFYVSMATVSTAISISGAQPWFACFSFLTKQLAINSCCVTICRQRGDLLFYFSLSTACLWIPVCFHSIHSHLMLTATVGWYIFTIFGGQKNGFSMTRSCKLQTIISRWFCEQCCTLSVHMLVEAISKGQGGAVYNFHGSCLL